MTVDDELQRRQDDLARAELRRIFSQGKPPSNTPLEAFGPWAAYLAPLRQAFVERGLRAAQEVCLALIRLHPPLGLLLAEAWQPDPVAPAPRLRPRPKAGKVVRGPNDGRLVPYLLAGPVLPPNSRQTTCPGQITVSPGFCPNWALNGTAQDRHEVLP